jgi:hypothetical protein
MVLTPASRAISAIVARPVLEDRGFLERIAAPQLKRMNM